MSTDLPIKASDFQRTVKGKQTDLFILQNAGKTRVAVTNYGARIVAVWAPDRDGNADNIVAGYPSIDDYLERDELYLGATVGRYANRIGGASFMLHGKTYTLPANEGNNLLHGGAEGFHNVVWDHRRRDDRTIIMEHRSPDGTSGFPGTLLMQVVFRLNDHNELDIEYHGKSDKDTVLNVTNHAYFNLGGASGGADVREHRMRINAGHFTPVGPDLVPTGEIVAVGDTPFDFRSAKAIGKDINDNHPQIKRGQGYDHNFVLNKSSEDAYTNAAWVEDTKSGRRLEVKTTEPGLQFYECRFGAQTGLNLDSAFCLETQHYPDSPNKLHFPSVVLKSKEDFYSKTSYIFSTG